MIATGDNRCGCRSDICQCEADLGFDIKPWHFISEQLRARAAQAGEFLQKRTMARPDSAYLPCEISAGPPGEAVATCLDTGPTFRYGNGTTGG